MTETNSRVSQAGFKPYQIRAFLAIAEHLSIRSAAKVLFVSQPSVTRTLRELELELGVPLVNRGTRGVTLTVYGEAFRVRARLLHEEGLRARDELDQIKSGLRGLVRIAVTTLPAMLLLPRALQAFRKRMPQAMLECRDGYLPVALPALRSGQLDFVLTQFPLNRLDDDLVCEPLFGAETAVCARADHPRSDSRDLADLAGEEWIGWDRTMIERLFDSNGIAPPQRIFISESIDVARALVAEGDMLSLFSLPLLDLEMTRHGIRRIDIRNPLPRLTVTVVTRQDSQPTPGAALLLDLVREVAAQQR